MDPIYRCTINTTRSTTYTIGNKPYLVTKDSLRFGQITLQKHLDQTPRGAVISFRNRCQHNYIFAVSEDRGCVWHYTNATCFLLPLPSSFDCFEVWGTPNSRGNQIEAVCLSKRKCHLELRLAMWIASCQRSPECLLLVRSVYVSRTLRGDAAKPLRKRSKNKPRVTIEQRIRYWRAGGGRAKVKTISSDDGSSIPAKKSMPFFLGERTLCHPDSSVVKGSDLILRLPISDDHVSVPYYNKCCI